MVVNLSFDKYLQICHLTKKTNICKFVRQAMKSNAVATFFEEANQPP